MRGLLKSIWAAAALLLAITASAMVLARRTHEA